MQVNKILNITKTEDLRTKAKCDICGKENGSCNQYELRQGQTIIICPSCLVWGMDETSKMVRQAHKEGRLVKDEAAKARKARK